MNAYDWAVTPARRRDALPIVAGTIFSILLIAAVSLIACWVVGTRSLDVGTDTSTYAVFYERVGHESMWAGFEPGFVALSLMLRRLGLSLLEYQGALFATLLLTVFLAVHFYHRALGRPPGKLSLLSASLMLLFISPMFVNASINAVRQGLSALPVFAALLAFQQRRWWLSAGLGLAACSLHFSSALYLLFAPLLLLRYRTLRVLAVIAFLAYATGLSTLAVRTALPALYELVMSYTANTRTRSGVRIDFAVFSLFWYLLAQSLLPLVRANIRDALRESTAVYLVMLLPFFAVGWGFFSNRYLVPAWMAASLIFAAIVHSSRIRTLRHPLTIRAGLIASCAVFVWFVTHGIVI